MVFGTEVYVVHGSDGQDTDSKKLCVLYIGDWVMKHLKFYLLFLFSAVLPLSHANGQEHGEYYPQGTTWIEEKFYVTYNDGFFSEFRKYRVDGETDFNGKKYKIINVDYRKLANSEDYYDPIETWNWIEQPKILIREQGDSIYYIRPGKDHEALRYDFDWHIGKQIPIYYDWYENKYYYEKLKKIYKVKLLDGNTYAYIRYQVEGAPERTDIFQINGIGYTGYDGLYEGIFDGADGFFLSLRYRDYKLISFTRNDQLIYKWDRDVDKILGIDKVENDNRQKCGKTYTVYGTEVDASDMQSLPRGIYIRNGKKFLVK